MLLDTDRNQRISLHEWTHMFHISTDDEISHTGETLMNGGRMVSAGGQPTRPLWRPPDAAVVDASDADRGDDVGRLPHVLKPDH